MKNRFITFIMILGLTVFIFFDNPAQAEAQGNQHYQVPRVDAKIKPDGILDEEAGKRPW
jgi:hypothetical protein